MKIGGYVMVKLGTNDMVKWVIRTWRNLEMGELENGAKLKAMVVDIA